MITLNDLQAKYNDWFTNNEQEDYCKDHVVKLNRYEFLYIIGKIYADINQEKSFMEDIDAEWKTCMPKDEGMGLETANITNEQFMAIAKHYYEMGKNSK